MRRILLAVLVIGATVLVAGHSSSAEKHKSWTLNPVAGSGVTGKVTLHQNAKGGTKITVSASGLQPNVEYVSIYYDNSTCELQPDSQDDVFARYRGNDRGTARAVGQSDDDLDEIHSVSVRLGDGLVLQACASDQP